MRSRPLAALLLTLTVSVAACQVIWSYDDFGDQPRTGESDAGSDAGSDAESDASGIANGLACEAGTDCQSGNCVPGPRDDGEGDAGNDAGDDAGNDAGNDAGDDAGDDAGNDAGDGGGMVCCAAPCGKCLTCDHDGNACAPVPEGAHTADCTGSLVCDGAGECKVQNGGSCRDNGGADMCLSGICVLDVCCAVDCPACYGCKDGSGCTPKGFGFYDPRCMSALKRCNGFGGCT